MAHVETIQWFIQHVTAQLGQAEQPLGSNRQKYGEQFGWDGVSWCAEFGWDMYDDAGVLLPVKSAACVVVYDEAAKHGLVYHSTNCVPGDSVIRTWQHLPRAQLNPEETHYQTVVGTHIQGGVKYLDLIGGNQGPGVVSRDTVRAGDSSVLGGLAFHKLFDQPHTGPVHHDDNDPKNLPAAKSHKYPRAFLSLGSHGPLVGDLQHRLTQRGFAAVIDGSFGRQTLTAVIGFQKHIWPHVAKQWDGVVGVNTYKALGY